MGCQKVCVALYDLLRLGDELIAEYFHLGYSYKEILACLLAINGIKLSLRQLKRCLKCQGLKRRSAGISDDFISDVIMLELNSSGCNWGYRTMHTKLISDYGINTSREAVRLKIKELDPEGVERRSKHRLKRRQYSSKGPNYVWHLDGYDKLKPYGFCVHGCIDGYSRKILWLEVASSNNNPALIASYYVKYVKEIQGTARKIRGDFGTENLNVAAIQRYFRKDCTDAFSKEKSFLFGKSTSNQRIEAWWGRLRQYTAQYWMNFFKRFYPITSSISPAHNRVKDMIDDGTHDTSNDMARDCLLYCFTPLLQKELNGAKKIHNCHRIRPYSNQECPSGRPNLLYNIPAAYDSQDYKSPVSIEFTQIAEEVACVDKPTHACNEEFALLATRIMDTLGWTMPTSPEDAKCLYIDLLDYINDL